MQAKNDNTSLSPTSDVIGLISKQAQRLEKRKLTHVKPIPDANLIKYSGLLIGNDPLTSLASCSAHQIDGEFAFVGTSLFGAVRRACNLAKPPLKGVKSVPHVIIVDNSYEVAMCWEEIKKFFASTKLDNRSSFPEINSELFTLIDERLFDYLRDADVNDIYSFFRQLFTDHSFDYVKDVVLKLVILKQSWSDAATFRAIKDAFDDMPIVAYPSNIISWIDDSSIKIGVLKCIELLNPKLCVYSDLVGLAPNRRPSNTYMLASEKFTIQGLAESLRLDRNIIQACTSPTQAVVKASASQPLIKPPAASSSLAASSNPHALFAVPKPAQKEQKDDEKQCIPKQ